MRGSPLRRARAKVSRKESQSGERGVMAQIRAVSALFSPAGSHRPARCAVSPVAAAWKIDAVTLLGSEKSTSAERGSAISFGSQAPRPGRKIAAASAASAATRAADMRRDCSARAGPRRAAGALPIATPNPQRPGRRARADPRDSRRLYLAWPVLEAGPMEVRTASEVRLEGVSKRYDGAAGRPALEELDLTVRPGELAVLVGPSGCGKSTTLRIVAGLEEPSSGRVFIGEREVTSVPPAQRDIAMVFQSYALYPHMSVYDNLAFALRMRRRPEAEIRQRVTQVARALAIEEYLERRPRALSGGQRQRVAIGRAVVREP